MSLCTIIQSMPIIHVLTILNALITNHLCPTLTPTGHPLLHNSPNLILYLPLLKILSISHRLVINHLNYISPLHNLSFLISPFIPIITTKISLLQPLN